MAFILPGRESHRDRHDKRAAELITRLAAEFISRESNGTSLITATRATLSANAERATVFVSVFPESAAATAIEFLNRRADDFRAYLRAHTRMRDLPRIAFALDFGEKNRQRLDELGAE